MDALKMMLRVFTTVFGTTHPKPEEEGKYALFLLGMVISLIAVLAGVVWLVANFLR